MIPRILTALSLALIAAPLDHAQLLHSYGLRVGANSSTLDADIVDFQRRTGFQAAAFAELLSTPVFSVLTEAEYARRGYVSEQEERGPDNEPIGVARATTTHHYLSVPVLARVRYPGAITPYVLAGPRLDFLVGRTPGRFEFSNGTEVAVEDELGQNVESTSLSGSVGIGAAFGALLGREVRLETRYNFGMTDLLPEGDAVDLRHGSFDFSVGVVL